ncbi:MAG: 50S ribosomal protein L6 [Myxococcales bacterium]|nr:50S ribosomal protein L6 [Myxococcales bacterium]
MSRIGNRAIDIPKGVSISIKPGAIEVKGPKGTLSTIRHAAIEIKEEKGQLVFTRSGNSTPEKAAHGLMRALTNNLITGVTTGFTRTLEINGVGYRAEVKGSHLVMTLGYSHPVEYTLPDGVAAKVEKNNLILSGMDKQVLGAAAAKLRSFRAPEPYKGKGVKYAEETIIRKAGKAAGKGK